MAQSSLDDISPPFEHSSGLSPSPAAAELPTATETMGATHPHDDVDDTGFPALVPIAIVGMAMRLPGGVTNARDFWQMLINKRDGLCRVPRDRYNIDAFYHCDGVPGTIRTEHGCFLQQDIAQMDTGFFGMSKVEASKLDPQQRMLLEVVWESWSHPSNSEGPDLGEQEDKLRYFLAEIDKDPSILNDPDTENQFTYELGKMIATPMSYPEDMELEELAAIAIDSLMAIEIRSWFRRHFKFEISLLEIANAGTVGGLSKATMKILRAKYASEELKPGDGSAMLDAHRGEADNAELCLRDWELGRDLHPIAETAPEWHAPDEGPVLFTRATGFLGAYLLSLLVGLPHVQQVVCLVRAPNAETGLSRIKKAFQRYGLPLDFESKLKVVAGDIVNPMLGLGTKQYAELAEWASVVFHLAAVVDYTLPCSYHRDANVMGLLHLLRFANTGRLKSFHYTSSISAWGTRIYLTGEMVPEDERPPFDLDALEQLFGYAQSKVVAEQLAWNALANGFPVTIHRPGYVTAHSVPGMSKASDLVNYLMSSCIRLGSYPAAPNIRNQFTPVDICCSALLRLSLAPASLGHAFNIVRPDQSQTVTFEETFELLSRECSSPLRRLPTAEWIEEF
ncbi:hypothetical protein ASPACDRAFT_46846 [Aspergillus aculeatus ATCC 16872]|uniref:Carrier domain-containing protein n=1 Tax=Aspergillus aculeatus (strain ATCC 16872 / CBS 172.66 / WB 5094) TaxID=690307 RepID=A0A1L9WKI1_ASPA1|nr:uncharacterized protein ASPACDRAFT_46846 [Aspergillus aculeatus ATCC 16872]OJJ96674.1 hypothetical protein ASPACDRAFT_46846 [Aspergillus aculeatus ATCC 16872]